MEGSVIEAGRTASRPAGRGALLARVAVVSVAAVICVYLLGAGWLASSLIGDKMLRASLEFSDDRPTSPTELGFRGDPRQAFGLAFSDVSIATPVGPAPAWLVAGTGSTWAIYVHGIKGHREDGYRHLSVLATAGYPTLLITYRNDDAAPPDPTGMVSFGLSEWRDLQAAVDYALTAGATRVILIGSSMGGGIIGQFLARSPTVDRIVAVVLDSPALDGPAVIMDMLSTRRLPFASAIGTLGVWLADRRYPVQISEAVCVEAVARYRGPLFIAHGDRDQVVPVAISDRVVTTRIGVTTFLRTHGEHLQSWQEDPERYRRELAAFLQGVGR